MARRKTRRRRAEAPEASVPVQELSLEEILEEYRAGLSAEQEPEPERPEAHPLELAPEEDGVLSTQVPRGEDFPELDEPDVIVPAEEYPEIDRPQADAFDMPAETAERTSLADQLMEPEKDDEISAPVLDNKTDHTLPRDVTEGFEDDADFYAGPVEETETQTTPEQEETSAEEPARPRRERRRGSPAPTVKGLWGRFVTFLAASSVRREQRKSQPEPDPEDTELEMEPRKAARHYSAQMPSLRLRTMGAGAVCLLLVWISLSMGFGWPLPGSLDLNPRAVALVCMAAQLTVMLLGLDIITSGVMSVIRGRPGAESLLALSCLASLLDGAALVITGNGTRGVPYSVLPAAAVFFALWGAWFSGRGFYDSFLTLFHIQEPNTLTSEELPDRGQRGLITSRIPAKGFIRRSEEPCLAESMAGIAFLPMAAGSAALSLAVGLGSRDMGAFFHLFALLTGLCGAFGWLFSYPLLFARTARHLMMNGSAVAGWSGARDMGTSRQLVLTDTDIFPEDTLEITGIRILDKSNAENIIACTGSMLATAGTGSAAVFTELMRRYKAALQQVDSFTVGEGGAKGTIAYAEIRVGTAGYMHLSGVKIPDKVKADNALFTAINGELAGVFLFRYRPMASVQRALVALRRARRKPIFAVRDFNLDPMMVRREFDVSTEGFQFPSFAERYKLSSVPSSDNSLPAGVMGQEGLDAVVDLTESGTGLFLYGRICAWSCLVSAVLGAALMIVPCWLGSWTAVSAARVLLYMLSWLLPTLASALLLRK